MVVEVAQKVIKLPVVLVVVDSHDLIVNVIEDTYAKTLSASMYDSMTMKIFSPDSLLFVLFVGVQNTMVIRQYNSQMMLMNYANVLVSMSR